MLNIISYICCFVALATPSGPVRAVTLPYYFTEEEMQMVQLLETEDSEQSGQGEKECIEEFLPDKIVRHSKGDKVATIYC